MRRHIMRYLLMMIAWMIVIGIGGETLRFNAWANENTPVALSQSLNPMLQHAQLLHAASESQTLRLSIGLQMQNSTMLDALLQNIYNPQSPQFGHYISPGQFKQLFAPTDTQVQLVTSFLQSNGCSISAIGSNNLLIDATCNVSQAQQAFNTSINIYKNGNNTFLANSSALKIPVRLKNVIASITGLDSSENVRPLYRQRRQASKETVPVGYSPAALAKAYDFAPLQNAGYLGDNQTVAVLELDGFKQSDIDTYYHAYNLNTLQRMDGTTQAAPDVTTIKVKNAKGVPGDGAIEATLDLEMLLGLVPHAHILAYVGENKGMQGFNDVLNQIVTDNKARVVDISWEVTCEANATPGREWQVVDNLLKQGIAEGMSFFAASGDAGAYDCLDTNLQV
ncbi:MAG: hypothetical protein JO011_17065, partial [Ktedonobacteraceae bacterium]|nr:hypothetical protein [Ktedonobacteraceae bacterium]